MILSRLLAKNGLTLNKNNKRLAISCTRWMSDLAAEPKSEPTGRSTLIEKSQLNARQTPIPPNYRFVYPEFLPDPKMEHRHMIREKVERYDMLDRRAHIDIPEFYVGTIMAVTRADQHSSGKISRFVGICVQREGCGLRANFTLRNVVDHQGVEIIYELYDPTLQKIEVLRLEKRLDDKLLYLRDAPPEYSTFPFDMEPEMHPEGEPVPINPIQVRLKPRPWVKRWERYNLKGVSNAMDLITEKMKKQMVKPIIAKPWEKYDIMAEYRKTIPEEEQHEIYSEVYANLNRLSLKRKKILRKRTIMKPTKLG